MKAMEDAAERAMAAAEEPAVGSSEPGSSGKGPTGGGGRVITGDMGGWLEVAIAAFGRGVSVGVVLSEPSGMMPVK